MIRVAPTFSLHTESLSIPLRGAQKFRRCAKFSVILIHLFGEEQRALFACCTDTWSKDICVCVIDFRMLFFFFAVLIRHLVD